MNQLSRRKKLLLAAAVYVYKRKREYWVHPINRLRPKLGDHVKLDIKYRQFPDRFKKETRLTPPQFDELLLMTEQQLQTKAPRRDCVHPRVRLYVTLK